MKFRFHKGGLSESMNTVVEFDSFEELVKIIKVSFNGYPLTIDSNTLRISPYKWDERISWDTHIVVLDDYGVVGMTDGPVKTISPDKTIKKDGK